MRIKAKKLARLLLTAQELAESAKDWEAAASDQSETIAELVAQIENYQGALQHKGTLLEDARRASVRGIWAWRVRVNDDGAEVVHRMVAPGVWIDPVGRLVEFPNDGITDAGGKFGPDSSTMLYALPEVYEYDGDDHTDDWELPAPGICTSKDGRLVSVTVVKAQ